MIGKYLVALKEEPIGIYYAASPREAIEDCKDHMRSEGLKESDLVDFEGFVHYSDWNAKLVKG